MSATSGRALSVADIVAALFAGPLASAAAGDADRDRFVLSKGHAALALYAALHETRRLSGEALSTFCGDDTPLGAHPEHSLEGIDFSTGSLGHGLSIGAGAALGGSAAGIRPPGATCCSATPSATRARSGRR